MKILAVETTGTKESVAVYNNGKVTEINRDVKFHSAHLLRNIDKVLKKANTRLKDLDYLAASIGPGSFTGIRIGLSTMQGLSLALDIPLVGVSTLDVIAENAINSYPRAGNVALLACKSIKKKKPKKAVYPSPVYRSHQVTSHQVTS